MTIQDEARRRYEAMWVGDTISLAELEELRPSVVRAMRRLAEEDGYVLRRYLDGLTLEAPSR